MGRTKVIIRSKSAPRKKEMYSVGGILSSTGSMAATGAMVGGPWGAAIGGAVGLGAGIYGHVQEGKAQSAEDEMLAKQKAGIEAATASYNFTADDAQLKDYMTQFNNYALGGVLNDKQMSGYNNKRGLYAMGGQLQQVNSTDQVAQGPSHGQGGVDVPGTNAEVEGGENVRINPMTGQQEVDSARLGTAQANQPLMEEKAKLEQQLQALKQAQAKMFLGASKSKSFRQGNELERKQGQVDSQVEQLEQQLAGIQQAIEANFQQQQQINGNSQGQPEGEQGMPQGEQQFAQGGDIPPNPYAQANMFSNAYNYNANNIGMPPLQRFNMGSTRNQFQDSSPSNGLIQDSNGNWVAPQKKYEISAQDPNSPDYIKPANLDGLGVYPPKSKGSGITGITATNPQSVNRPNGMLDPNTLATSKGGFGKPVAFGQGKGAFGNASLDYNNPNVMPDSAVYDPITKQMASPTSAGIPTTEVPKAPRAKGNFRIGATGASAIGQGLAGVGTFLANREANKRLENMDLNYLDKKSPIMYTTNRNNVNESMIDKKVTEARMAYQNNPTAANHARYQQTLTAGYDASAKDRQFRENQNNQIGNANKQAAWQYAQFNTGIDKYNYQLKHNKDMTLLNSKTANVQGLINSGAKAWGIGAQGIINNRQLANQAQMNPDAALSRTYRAEDYSFGNNTLLKNDMQQIANAQSGTKQIQQLRKLQKVSGRTTEQINQLAKELGLDIKLT